MHAGETVGILMDTNMTPPQGVFVPFFGVEACTASGLARVALKSGAAVLPGFLLWEEAEKKYVLRFGEELELVRTGDAAADVVANTALFTAAIEAYVRRYPEQWLWVHRRWKTRPRARRGCTDERDDARLRSWLGLRRRCGWTAEIARVSGIGGRRAGCGGVCAGWADAGGGAGSRGRG